MAENPDKLIVSNRSALLKKYGEVGLKLIEAAVKQLIAADKRRKITSRLVYLDQKEVREFHARPISKPSNVRENKNAIDALFRSCDPDYIMLLGSQDVIPHVKLGNLAHDEDGLIIDSDLPYACDARFSRNPRHFLAPTRVVGRLPDINGGKDPAYIIRLLETATETRPQPRDGFATWFALSAKDWTGSSAITAASLFNEVDALELSPPAGPGKLKDLDRARVHFFNCHGDRGANTFWGQRGNSQPRSFHRSDVPQKLLPGTFIAAECCYGAEQYAPDRKQPSISATYLFNGAAAYVGSTTIAYGPETGQDDADLIAQYFVSFVLRGHSVGRAFLEAQQKFIKTSAPRIDSIELKTLTQFLLLGDPSLHVVEPQHRSLAVKNGKILIESKPADKKVFRKLRRKQLKESGDLAAESVETPRNAGKRIGADRHRKFSKLARANGLKTFSAASFRFGDRKNGETHYVYVEKKKSKNRRHRPRVIIFKEIGHRVDVRLYEPK